MLPCGGGIPPGGGGGGLAPGGGGGMLPCGGGIPPGGGGGGLAPGGGGGMLPCGGGMPPGGGGGFAPGGGGLAPGGGLLGSPGGCCAIAKPTAVAISDVNNNFVIRIAIVPFHLKIKTQLKVETKQTTYQLRWFEDRWLEGRRAVVEPVDTPVVADIAVGIAADNRMQPEPVLFGVG